MRNLAPRLIVVLGLVLVMAGSAIASSGRSDASQAKLKVALLLPCPINDASWCQQGYVAAKRLQKEGLIDLKVTTPSPQDTAGATQLISRYAASGSQLIIAHSAYQDAAWNAAKRFPKTPIAFGGGGKVGKNVSTYEEPIYIPAYLAGMLAAGISKTGVIGGISSFDFPLCHAMMESYKLGAKVINKNIKQITTYTGDWNDSSKYKSATLAAADQGADVFEICGDPAGVISAVKERNLSAFGYVGNQNRLAPKNMVGSMVYNLYPIFKAMVKDVQNGTYKGKSYDLGLASFNLPLNPAYSAGTIPPAVMAKMNATRKLILTGKFKVPYIPS